MDGIFVLPVRPTGLNNGAGAGAAVDGHQLHLSHPQRPGHRRAHGGGTRSPHGASTTCARLLAARGDDRQLRGPGGQPAQRDCRLWARVPHAVGRARRRAQCRVLLRSCRRRPRARSDRGTRGAVRGTRFRATRLVDLRAISGLTGRALAGAVQSEPGTIEQYRAISHGVPDDVRAHLTERIVSEGQLQRQLPDTVTGRTWHGPVIALGDAVLALEPLPLDRRRDGGRIWRTRHVFSA